MTKTVDSAFVTKWGEEAHITFEEEKSVLWEHVKKVPADNSRVHSFTTFANVDAQADGKTQGSDLTRVVATTTNVTATMKIPYIQISIDDWDAALTSVNYRESVNQMAVNAVMQQIDDQLIDVLDATTNSEITLPSANTFNFAGARKMAETLSSNNVPHKGRYGLISEGAMTDLVNDTTYMNNFNFQNDVIASGMAKGVAGLDLMTSNRLSNGAAGATERMCFVWQEDAFKVAVNRDFQISIDWDARLQGWLYTASVIMQGAIIDQLGVQTFDVTN